MWRVESTWSYDDASDGMLIFPPRPDSSVSCTNSTESSASCGGSPMTTRRQRRQKREKRRNFDYWRQRAYAYFITGLPGRKQILRGILKELKEEN